MEQNLLQFVRNEIYLSSMKILSNPRTREQQQVYVEKLLLELGSHLLKVKSYQADLIERNDKVRNNRFRVNEMLRTVKKIYFN